MSLGTPTNLNTPDRTLKSVRNVGTNAITAGQPVAYVMNGTEDGVAAAASNDALVTATRATSLFAGIAVADIPVGKLGNVCCRGVVTARATTDGTNALAVGTTLTVAVASATLAYSAAGAASPTKAMLTSCQVLAINQTNQPCKVYVNAL